MLRERSKAHRLWAGTFTYSDVSYVHHIGTQDRAEMVCVINIFPTSGFSGPK